MIDWSKLEPYDNDKSRSFEELCFQIAKGLCEQKGKFTPIDDSGGGDGVEFYMTLPNGDQWGWQAKFYYPNERLKESNRKKAIQDSLKKSCEKHPSLKKWFLCTPTTFTPNQKTKKSENKGELDWFENTLPKSIPPGREVELVHWGDSNFNTWLSEPRFSGKKNYFFAELELNFNWFYNQVDKQIALIQDKFNPILHTETHIDEQIHQVLGDEVFNRTIAQRITKLKNKFKEYKEAVNKLNSSKPDQIDWGTAKIDLFVAINPLQDALGTAIKQLQKAHKLLNEHSLDEVRRLDESSIFAQTDQAYKGYTEAESVFDISQLTYTGEDKDRERVLREAERIVHQPARFASSLTGDLRSVFARLTSISQTDLHIFGNAGVGKTHIASNICHQRLEANLPALLVLGRHFTSGRTLEEQLRSILDIPPAYSWNDFLQALATAAEAYRTRIPIVIDGLNEAIYNGTLSKVWKLGLPGLIRELEQTKNILLITTCRTTYKEAIWSSSDPQNIKYTSGFGAYDVETAIEKYFNFYKIKADITAAPLYQFEHPIYLKIFCESQNPKRQEEKHIYIGQQTLFEVFDDYLEQCNGSICERLGLRRKIFVVKPAMNKMAEYLWQYQSRSIPLDELARMVDGQPIETLKWEQSKTNAMEDEGLLIYRDWQEDAEVAYFTYDLLGGYLIARYLIENSGDTIEVIVQSEEFIARLFSNDFQTLHPLYSDIGRCLAALLPVQKSKYLHDLLDNSSAYDLSIKALFEIPPQNISEACISLIAHLFKHPQNRQRLLELAESTIGHIHHPLNASFWSEQLKLLPMPERDISWTEYVRSNDEQYERTLARFEATCQSDETLSKMMQARLRLLAERIMWVLTSTVRPLRDKATRALYWYGRRQPEQFLDLVLNSLEINDPYVPERMLAATYGVAMARQYDFKDSSFAEKVLPVYGNRLYEAMFKQNAPYATTHILSRDYAKRTIDIALIHHPNLLTEEEKQRITPPFTDGGIREWGECEDKDKGKYRDNAPMDLDFERNTLHTLMLRNQNSDKVRCSSNNWEILTRNNLFWRIYNLGYSLEKFGNIDQKIEVNDYYNRNNRRNDAEKTDCYGKKYLYIACYELAGFREDKGILYSTKNEPRIAYKAHIDPSFPASLQQYKLNSTDFLGNRDVTTQEWILNGGNPDLKSNLIVKELCGERGPWVLLDGHIHQANYEANRTRLTFPRGFIVQNDEVQEIIQMQEQPEIDDTWVKDLETYLLPCEDYYAYAGEIPWCDTYPANEWCDLSLLVKTKFLKKVILLRNSEPISSEETDKFWKSIEDLIEKNDEEAIDAAMHEKNLDWEIKNIELKEEVEQYKNFSILIPVRINDWGDWHSTIIPGRRVATPAREIIEHLDLCSQPQTFDLFEKNGRRASITFSYGDEWNPAQLTHYFDGNEWRSEQLVYLRQDLLERFLAETNSELIWMIWGERKFSSEERGQGDDFDDQQPTHKVFQDIQTYGNLK